MNQEKIYKFYQAAIEKTKSGALTWKRARNTSELSRNSYFRNVADEERSFVSEYGTGKIFLLAEALTGDISCHLLPDVDLSYQQLGDENEPLLLRFYNVVYSQFPSVDSFIDNFISDF